MKLKSDILVVGGGLVGLTAAFALARRGHTVAICAPEAPQQDPRTTALLHGSIAYLQKLDLWSGLEEIAHPLKIMRLVDATNRLVRFQQTDFRSTEIGLDAFGYNIRNADYMDQLQQKLTETDTITVFNGLLETIDCSDDGTVTANIVDKNKKTHLVETGFVVGADGKHSKVREYFADGVQTWDYPQHAIVTDFEHELDSRYVSTEFHTETGPFTIVPQTSKRAGLVWLESPEKAEELVAFDDQMLNDLLEMKMHSFLGKVRILKKPVSFPMSGLTANRFGDQHFALIGEAAHVFPPIGAQGFNLGIRDIEDLAACLMQFTSTENAGQQYHSKRMQDIKSRTFGVDLLNRSLLSDFLPVQIARSLGMLALGTIAPLRKKAMQTGIFPLK